MSLPHTTQASTSAFSTQSWWGLFLPSHLQPFIPVQAHWTCCRQPLCWTFFHLQSAASAAVGLSTFSLNWNSSPVHPQQPCPLHWQRLDVSWTSANQCRYRVREPTQRTWYLFPQKLDGRSTEDKASQWFSVLDVGASCFLQCTDTVDWATGTASQLLIDWLSYAFTSHSIQKQVVSETLFPANLLASTEETKPNTTQEQNSVS